MKKLISIGLSLGVLLMSSCEDFFDINDDPNNPTEASVDLLLTNTELAVVNSLGMSTSGLSAILSVYMHQTTRRQGFDAYNVLGSDYPITQAWSQFYSIALEDIREMKKIGEEEEAWEYVGIAQILEAYAYSQMVDVWGDIPFTQSNTSPETYTPQINDDAEIYPQIFTMLDEGITNLEKESTLSPGSDDLIYGGDLDSWRKFAKTVKLKLYNQLRLVQDVSSEVNALLAEDDLISDQEEDFELAYGQSQSPDNRNPGFIADNLGTRIYYISVWFYETLTGQNPALLNGISDPRVPYYWYNQLSESASPQSPAEYRDGAFLSIYFGSTGPNQAGLQDQSQTILGMYPVGGRFDDGGAIAPTQTDAPGDVPQRILTYYARLYIEAELALAGVTSGDARALLESAMQASFDKVNEVVANYDAKEQDAPEEISDEDIEAYINSVLARYDAGDNNTKLEIIMAEKWIASFGYSVDAYTDYRRTGYPQLYDPDTDNLSFTNASKDFPTVLPYSATEVELNPNVQQQNPTATKVFWDAN